MRLQRRASSTSVKYEEASTEWTTYDGAEAHADFMHFGEGTERTSYFRVVLTSADIEAALNALADNEHEGAMRVRKALRLANAVADLNPKSDVGG